MPYAYYSNHQMKQCSCNLCFLDIPILTYSLCVAFIEICWTWAHKISDSCYCNVSFVDFTWKRAVFRTICVLVVLFVAESVPNFGPILSLIGASTNTLLGIVLPCVFYLKLCSMENSSWPERYVLFNIKVWFLYQR